MNYKRSELSLAVMGYSLKRIDHALGNTKSAPVLQKNESNLGSARPELPEDDVPGR